LYPIRRREAREGKGRAAIPRIGLSDAELPYPRLAHFDFVIWDAQERAVAVWECDGVHHITDPEHQRRDRLKDSICRKIGLPLYRVSGRPSVHTIRRMTKPQTEDRISLRARRLAGMLGKEMLFFLTVLLLTIGFYLGWTDGNGVTLPGASLFLPYVLLAPLVIGAYLIRDAPGSAQ
jgi:hypothetical protein